VSDHAGWKEGGWKAKSKELGLVLCQCRKRHAKKSKDLWRGDGSCLLALFLTSTFPVAQLSGLVNGTLVSTFVYDPYGNLLSSTGSVANPWRFAGGYFDSSTGLYKFGTRYYNPGFGRWSQQDPLRGQLNDPTSLNRYVYAGDDPVNVTDPSGKLVMPCLFAILTNLFLDYGLGILLFNAIAGAFAVAALIPVPIVDVIVGVLLLVLIWWVTVNIAIYLWNSTVVPSCGAPELPYVPNV
jgi:RHS repeat-associated protein